MIEELGKSSVKPLLGDAKIKGILEICHGGVEAYFSTDNSSRVIIGNDVDNVFGGHYGFFKAAGNEELYRSH